MRVDEFVKGGAPVGAQRREAAEELPGRVLVGGVLVHLVGVEEEKDRFVPVLPQQIERPPKGWTRPPPVTASVRYPAAAMLSARVSNVSASAIEYRPASWRATEADVNIEACAGSVQFAAAMHFSARRPSRKKRSSRGVVAGRWP